MRLVPYEIQVLKLLLAERISESEWKSILATYVISGYNYTGAGYYLEMKCQNIDFAKETIYKPTVLGKTGNLEVGFLGYLDKDTLTIECHGWGEKDPPANIRELDLKIWAEL